MEIEVITIGDELLIGQTINSNLTWLGKTLYHLGITVSRAHTIKDEANDIEEAVLSAFSKVDIVIVTGGLGPTQDDITKKTLAKYFGTELKRNKKVLTHIENMFSKYNREMLEVNRQQADLPIDASILFNDLGTASGMWFEKNGKHCISLPGVPYEMKHLIKDKVIPKLRLQFKNGAVAHKTVITAGVGESWLANQLLDFEKNIRNEGVAMAYLPSPGMVKLRFSLYNGDLNANEKSLNKLVRELGKVIPEHILSIEDASLEELIGKLLLKRKWMLATAESCTGGTVASKITSVSGASNYFKGSIIAYSEQIKIETLQVSQQIIKQYKIASEEVAAEMAKGVLNLFSTNVSIATTGIAGPNSDGSNIPIGTVCFAVAINKEVFTAKRLFLGERDDVIKNAANYALSFLYKCLLNA